ncbi:MAG: DNA replication and repair protein RecF [Bacteroidales bacterium]|nr:DNA replication and repair protein RecF [Bacteroidales bacterium]MDD3700510.1 DNA replication and repair protein RecF [Bacteroidales bacterium]MDY0370517.1 DNA replication and repair protein RecF [Bacteroidales bacterium]
MFLQQIRLTDFKNYASAELEFSEKINCFIGNNGSGKTNMLDAIYYLSYCKSYFNTIDQQNIRHHQDFFAIHGSYKRNGEIDTVSCVQKRNHKKSFRFNKKEYDRLADHIGKLPLVMISPYDRDLINEGSELRRKFVDSMISQSDPMYLEALIHYNKVLAQRNFLLRQLAENGKTNHELIEILNEQMEQWGMQLYEKRFSFLNEFTPVFEKFYAFVSDSKESVAILYETTMGKSPLTQQLAALFERDKALKFTGAGPHKDDLKWLINGYPLKKFGSQGQQKSFVIALKLAQFEHTHQLMGYQPILLFDDIFDKLDDQRVEQIIDLVCRENFGQVFITDTQQHRIQRLLSISKSDHRLFSIQSGAALPIQSITQ